MAKPPKITPAQAPLPTDPKALQAIYQRLCAEVIATSTANHKLQRELEEDLKKEVKAAFAQLEIFKQRKHQAFIAWEKAAGGPGSLNAILHGVKTPAPAAAATAKPTAAQIAAQEIATIGQVNGPTAAATAPTDPKEAPASEEADDAGKDAPLEESKK